MYEELLKTMARELPLQSEARCLQLKRELEFAKSVVEWKLEDQKRIERELKREEVELENLLARIRENGIEL